MRAAMLSLLLACGEGPPPPGVVPETVIRPAGHLTRLTTTAWVDSVEALTGVRYAGQLPDTERILGHASVGAAAAGVSPLDEEQYEAAAWDVARKMEPPRCAFTGTPAHPAPSYDDVMSCVEADLVDLAWRAWRRPVRADELATLTDVWKSLRTEAGDTVALQASRAAILSSPHFLYEVASGMPTPDGARRRNGHEMATRVAFALTGRGPSVTWLLDADSGGFDTAEGIRAHVDAAIADGSATEALTAYWRELFDVDTLPTLAKDSDLFPLFDATLRAALGEEFDALVSTTVLAPGADTRDLFTTRWLPDDPALRALYALSSDATSVGEERGGVLGRGAFAAVASHATTTSPTRRGLFILTRLLCQDIPPPPPGVVASLSAVADVPGTLRDKLGQHVSDPSCASCHASMDAAGFALEPIDATGAWRETDEGLPIDARVRLDGVDLDGPSALGDWVGSHPALARCLATDLWHHLTGSDDRSMDAVWIDAWTEPLRDGWHWTDLVADALTSDALRSIQGDEGWVAAEICNGFDDDGDGTVDDLRRGCTEAGTAGVARCVEGTWTACEVGGLPPAHDATCPGPSQNGAPADVAVIPTTFADLLRVMPSCEPGYVPAGRGCEVAADRLCAEATCGIGIGVVTGRDVAPWVACASTEAVTSHTAPWTDLIALDPSCLPGEVDMGGCHKAFDAWCRARGSVAGWGPNLDVGDAALGLCADEGERVGLLWGSLRNHGGCDRWESLQSGVCAEAAHIACQNAGYTTGWGPVPSADGTHDVDVVCFGAAP